MQKCLILKKALNTEQKILTLKKELDEILPYATLFQKEINSIVSRLKFVATDIADVLNDSIEYLQRANKFIPFLQEEAEKIKDLKEKCTLLIEETEQIKQAVSIFSSLQIEIKEIYQKLA